MYIAANFRPVTNRPDDVFLTTEEVPGASMSICARSTAS